MNCTERPWGTYEVLLDADDCKVKRITVKPGEHPSYQMHYKRSEKWVVVSGNGKVRIEDSLKKVGPGSVVDVPLQAKHTIVNDSDSDLVFIEVQLGEYFGEDDIVRLEDKYGRSQSPNNN